MARTVEHTDRHVLHLALGGLGERLDIVGGLLVEADQAVRIARTDGNLVHVGVRRVQQAAAGRDGEHGERVGHGFCGQRGAFQRIERNVDFRALPGADFLADIEHRGFVAFALADHDAAAELDLVEGGTHRVNRGGIGLLLVAPAGQLGGGDGGQFGDADHRVCETGGQILVIHTLFSKGGNWDS